MEFFSKRVAAMKSVFAPSERTTQFVNNHIDEPGQLYIEPYGHHPVSRYEFNEKNQVTQFEYRSDFPIEDFLKYLAAAGLEVTPQTVINEVTRVSEKAFTVAITEPSLTKLTLQALKALAIGRAA